MHSDRSGEIRLSPYLIIIEEIVKVLYKGHIVYVVIELPQRKEQDIVMKSPVTDYRVRRRSDDIYRLPGDAGG